MCACARMRAVNCGVVICQFVQYLCNDAVFLERVERERWGKSEHARERLSICSICGELRMITLAGIVTVWYCIMAYRDIGACMRYVRGGLYAGSPV